MNRDRYRLVYSRARGQWMAVAELASGSGAGSGIDGPSARSRRRRAALSGLIVASFALSPGAWPSAWAQTLPQGGVVVGGQAQITQGAANQLTITQQSSRSVIDWRSFNIGSGNAVQFVQPGASAQTLNRVTGTDASQIQGLLSANGQVFLVNPNGIVFGQGAVVDVGGLIATTRDIPSAAFMAGCQSLALTPIGNGSGIVTNDGTIRAIRGYVVLQGAQVRNSGSIIADGSSVALAAGDRATVSLSNGQLVSVQLDAAAADALVQSNGLIQAKGGQVLLTSRSANAVLSNAINLTGVVDVSAPAAASTAQASAGAPPAAGTAASAVQATSHSGRITVDGGEAGVTQLAGLRIDASSAQGSGGVITVTGERVALIEGTRIDARGATAGGSVKVGGGWQGNDATVRNARMTVLDESSRIDASATDQGSGGSVVLWSNEYTGFHGNIAASGGPRGGAGGSVETSSHDNLQVFGRVNASAPQGQAGHWLLDPTNVVISSAADTNVIVTGGLWTVTGSSATISNASINADLNAGTSVTVSTSSAGASAGSITINGDIVKSSGGNASLSLLADSFITLNANLTSTSNALDVTLIAPRTVTFRDTTIDLNGGTLTAHGGSAGGADRGIEFNGTSTFPGERDTVLIEGRSGTAAAVRLTAGSIVHSGNGSLSITGNSGTGIGMQFAIDTQLVQSGSGTLWINGVSGTGCGTLVSNTTLSQTGNGEVHLSGASDSRGGLVVSTARIDQTGAGNLSFSGTSNTITGTQFTSGTQLAQGGNGTVRIDGMSNTSSGTLIGATTITQQGSGMLRIDGVSDSGSGAWITADTSITQNGAGQLGISGTSNGGRGLTLNYAAVSQAGNGNLTINGGSLTANGTALLASNLTQTGNGALLLHGESANNAGIQIVSGSVLTQGGNGRIEISGSAGNGRAVDLGASTIDQGGNGTLFVTGNGNGVAGHGVYMLNSNVSMRSDGGTLRVDGSSQSGIGVQFTRSTIDQSGNGTLIVTGNSPADAGVALSNSQLLQSANGTIEMTGRSDIDRGLEVVSSSSINQTGNGIITLNGSSADNTGLAVTSSTFTQSDRGTLRISGTSNTGCGTASGTMTIIQSGAGQLELIGVSNSSYGISLITGNVNQSGSGDLALNGSSQSSVGVWINNGKALQSGTGRLLVSGQSISGDAGIALVSNSSITQTDSGQVQVNGTGASGYGASFSRSNIDQQGNGNLSVEGNSSTSLGVRFTASAEVRQSGNGTLDIVGLSNQSHGVSLASASLLTQSGNGSISLFGQSSSGPGVAILNVGTTVAQGGGGSLTITGVSQTSGRGTWISSSALTQAGDGRIDISGASDGDRGIHMTATTVQQDGPGNLTFRGTSNLAVGTGLASNSLFSQNGSGSLSISGTSNVACGTSTDNMAFSQAGNGTLRIDGASIAEYGTFLNSTTITQTGTGEIDISGTSVSRWGATLSTATVNQTGAGNLSIHGTSDDLIGMNLRLGAQVMQSGSGTLTISGQSTRRVGLNLNAGILVAQSGSGSLRMEGVSSTNSGTVIDTAAISQTGNGSLSINGTSASGQGLLIRDGNVTVGNASFGSAGGGINASVPLNVSGHLVLSASGPNADVLAANPANDLSGTVTVAQGRNVSLINSGTLSLGAANADGSISVSTQAGDLLINGDIASGAGNVTLVAGAAGPHGTTAPDPHGDVRRGSGQSISVGSGRTVVIYSGNPDTIGPTGLGSLVAATSDGSSGVNKYYATNISAGPGTGRIDPASPLNIFYRVRPTVTLSSGDAAKVYGTDDPDFQWIASGLVDGDTASSLGLNGHLGRASGEGVGNHALTLGNMTVGPGTGQSYGLAVQGNFAISPAAVLVTLDDQSKTAGQSDPAFTYTVSGAIDRTVQSVGPDGMRHGVAIRDDAASLMGGTASRAPGESPGAYPIGSGSLHPVNSNYTLSGTPIAPATLTIVAAPVVPPEPTEPPQPTEPNVPSLPQEPLQPQQPPQPGMPDGPGNPSQRLSGALGFVLPIARMGWPGDIDSAAVSRSDPLEYGAWRAVNPPLAESSATPAQAAAWTQVLPPGANVIRLPIVVASPSATAPSISDPYRNTEGPRAVGPSAEPVAMLQLHVDVLFQFGRSDVEGMLPAARADLDRFIDRLAAQGLAIDAVTIDGHADRLGSEQANQRVSQRRAQTVMRYLQARGMTARMGMQARGSSEPLTHCDARAGAALIACLQPNRRASVKMH